MKSPKVKLAVQVDALGVESLTRMVKAAEVVLDVVSTVEGRCMAADGPVSPTLSEMREDELRKLWKACRTIASTTLPELHVATKTAPLPKPETRRERIARVRRRKARRKSR